MYSIRDDMVQGLNAYFENQAKEDGKCLVDYIQFDNTYEVVYKGRPVAKATAEITPRGSTALLDAIGNGVTNLGAKLRKMSEKDRPGRVQVLVVTDGYENASLEWNKKAIKELIEQQENEWNWDFVFLGTGIDAVTTGTDLGFRTGSTLTFNKDNIDQMAETVSNYTSTYRGVGAANFSDEDRVANS